MPALLTTIVGLLMVLAGICCGWTAYSRTHGEHADGPLWPVLHRTGLTARRAWKRYVLRRLPITGSMNAALAVGVAINATGVVSGPEIDTDLPVEEQVRLLVHRVRNIENQASSDRARFVKDLAEVTTKVAVHAAELHAADKGIRDLARSIAVSTVKLQLWGLLLVGGGTVLMAVPTLVSLWATVN